MFEKFTDRARKVMALSNQEAQRFNHEYVGTEHVLLAMVKEGSGVAISALNNLDIDPRKVRLEVEKLIKSGPDMVTMGKLPLMPLTKLLIGAAGEVSASLHHNYIGTEHLLIAATRDQGIAGTVLCGLGLGEEIVRGAVMNLIGEAKPPQPPATPAMTRDRQEMIEDLTNLLFGGRHIPSHTASENISKVVIDALFPELKPAPEPVKVDRIPEHIVSEHHRKYDDYLICAIYSEINLQLKMLRDRMTAAYLKWLQHGGGDLAEVVKILEKVPLTPEGK